MNDMLGYKRDRGLRPYNFLFDLCVLAALLTLDKLVSFYDAANIKILQFHGISHEIFIFLKTRIPDLCFVIFLKMIRRKHIIKDTYQKPVLVKVTYIAKK